MWSESGVLSCITVAQGNPAINNTEFPSMTHSLVSPNIILLVIAEGGIKIKIGIRFKFKITDYATTNTFPCVSCLPTFFIRDFA